MALVTTPMTPNPIKAGNDYRRICWNPLACRDLSDLLGKKERGTHKYILNRASLSTSAYRTLLAWQVVGCDRPYFQPGKQHYSHFQPHCQLSSKSAVREVEFHANQGSLSPSMCPSLSTLIQARPVATVIGMGR